MAGYGAAEMVLVDGKKSSREPENDSDCSERVFRAFEKRCYLVRMKRG